MKFVINKAEYDALSDALKALYKVGGDGQYTLQIEGDIPGMVPKAKLDEFRDNNISLKQKTEQLEAAMAKLKDIDPDEYARLKTQADAIRDKKLIEEGKFEEVIQQRTEAMRREYENKYGALDKAHKDLTGKYDSTYKRLSGVLIDAELGRVIGDVGTVRKGAMTDLMNRARLTWSLKDDKLVAVNEEGNAVFGKDGKTPMTMAEWAADLATSAPYLFESSGGGGSGGGGKGGQGQGKGGQSRINAGNNSDFIANLDGIAKGTVQVEMGE